MIIETLAYEDMKWIESQLEEYDASFTGKITPGLIQLGIKEKGQVVAGVFASMSTFHILYVSMLFVSQTYRRKGYGSTLMQALEVEAKQIGAKYIRLDTFNFQGKIFYEKLGYEQIGTYTANDEMFSEHFFLKRL